MEGGRAFNHRNLRGNGFHVRNRDLRLEVEDAEVTDDVMRASCQADRWVPPGGVCEEKKNAARGTLLLRGLMG